MGSIPSNGIISGEVIEKNCTLCHTPFKCMSDDTITIKGPSPIRTLCTECNNAQMLKTIDISSFDNVKHFPKY
jgi:hypothetical protein